VLRKKRQTQAGWQPLFHSMMVMKPKKEKLRLLNARPSVPLWLE
jgi:hypothetical protein